MRGPLTMLRDTVAPSTEKPSNLMNYVNGFRHRLYPAGELSQKKRLLFQGKMKCLYDRQAKERTFSPGEQVLALMPLVHSPFQAKFCGLFTVAPGDWSKYILTTRNRRKTMQLCHVNFVKPYHCRKPTSVSAIAAAESILKERDNGVTGLDDGLLRGQFPNSETLWKLPLLLAHLSDVLNWSHWLTVFVVCLVILQSRTHLITHDIFFLPCIRGKMESNGKWD